MYPKAASLLHYFFEFYRRFQALAIKNLLSQVLDSVQATLEFQYSEFVLY